MCVNNNVNSSIMSGSQHSQINHSQLYRHQVNNSAGELSSSVINNSGMFNQSGIIGKHERKRSRIDDLFAHVDAL